MKLLESRKPCRPMLADRMPSTIRTMLSSSGVARVRARRNVEFGTGGDDSTLTARNPGSGGLRHVSCCDRESANCRTGLYARVAQDAGYGLLSGR